MNRQNESLNYISPLMDEVKIDPEEYEYFTYMENISNYIYDLMTSKGFTKSELAKRMKCSRSYITKILRGDENITLKTLIKIFFALGETIETRIVSNKKPVNIYLVSCEHRETKPFNLFPIKGTMKDYNFTLYESYSKNQVHEESLGVNYGG